VSATYNRAISLSSFSLPQNGKDAVKAQGADEGNAGLQGQRRSSDRLQAVLEL